MQFQVLNELHKFTQDFTAKFDENKAETQTCYHYLTSVEQGLEATIC